MALSYDCINESTSFVFTAVGQWFRWWNWSVISCWTILHQMNYDLQHATCKRAIFVAYSQSFRQWRFFTCLACPEERTCVGKLIMMPTCYLISPFYLDFDMLLPLKYITGYTHDRNAQTFLKDIIWVCHCKPLECKYLTILWYQEPLKVSFAIACWTLDHCRKLISNIVIPDWTASNA